MHARTILGLLVGFVVSLSVAAELPQGLVEGVTHSDGTMTLTPLGSSNPITVKPEPRRPHGKRNTLSKRYVSCTGTPLDRTMVDIAVQAVRNYAVNGQLTVTSGNGPRWFGYISGNVIVYYCINAAFTTGTAGLDALDYALAKMDATCAAYTTSFFQWDGTPSIIGKTASYERFCLG